MTLFNQQHHSGEFILAKSTLYFKDGENTFLVKKLKPKTAEIEAKKIVTLFLNNTDIIGEITNQSSKPKSIKTESQYINDFCKETLKGIIPFGQQKGIKVEAAENTHLKWIIENARKQPKNLILNSLKYSSILTLLERGEINTESYKKLTTLKDGKLKTEINSQYIKPLGARLELNGVITHHSSRLDQIYGGRNNFYKIITPDGNILIYSGKTHLGEKGDNINIKATIKKYDSYRDCRTNIISSPKTIKR